MDGSKGDDTGLHGTTPKEYMGKVELLLILTEGENNKAKVPSSGSQMPWDNRVVGRAPAPGESWWRTYQVFRQD